MKSRTSERTLGARKARVKPGTRRGHAERDLRPSRDQLEAILRGVAQGITRQEAVIATDGQGRVTLMNPVAESLTGWAQSNAAGKPLHEIFQIRNEQTRERVEDLFGLVLREGKAVSLAKEYILITRDGRQAPIENSAALITDAKGRNIGVVLMFRDTSERHKTEEAIGRLAAIVEYSEDAIFAKNMDAVITNWNRAAERLYGYSAQEVIGKPAAVIMPPDHPGELSDIMERLKRGERIEHFETERIAKDRRRIPIEVSISPIKDVKGAIIGASAIARDITKRKRAEADQRFLSEASELLSSSLDYERTLDRVARLAVPGFADWCAVHIVRLDETIEQISLAHKNPAKLQLGYELQQRYPPPEDANTGLGNVLRTGKSEMISDISDDMLVAAAQDEDHLRLMRQVGIKSYMVIPLVARGHTLGAMSFVTGESDRHFTEQDLGFAKLLASRAAIAIDNARLYHQSHKLNEELERRVVERTLELVAANRQLENEIEEHRRAEQALQNTERRFRELVELMPVAVYMCDASGLIANYNRSAAELWGREPRLLDPQERYCGSLKIYHPDGKWMPHEECPMARVLQTGLPKRNQELVVERPDGSRVIALANAIPFKNERGELVGAINCLLDITDRMHSQELQLKSEARLAEAQRVAHIGSWEWNITENTISWSDELFRLHGLAPEPRQIDYEEFLSRAHPDDRQMVNDAMQRCRRDHDPVEMEHRVVWDDGSIHWMHRLGQVALDGGGNPVRVYGTLQDIDQLKHAQSELQASYSQLRALTSQLQAVREEERSRIARELHDELGQALTALKYDLSTLASRFPKRNELLRAEAQEMSNAIDMTIKTVRRISTELRPGMLDDLGLATAIDWQGQEFAARTGIQCKVSLPEVELALDREQATAIFRIFQETLTNVARHAKATRVDVRLESGDDAFRLQVRDNGHGFDRAVARTKHSLGLLGMRERAELLGGAVDVESVIGQGTTVTVVMPLNSPSMPRQV
ncbi:MAG: PAS domain S-box protein [Anaerolineae bacterium]